MVVVRSGHDWKMVVGEQGQVSTTYVTSNVPATQPVYKKGVFKVRLPSNGTAEVVASAVAPTRRVERRFIFWLRRGCVVVLRCGVLSLRRSCEKSCAVLRAWATICFFCTVRQAFQQSGRDRQARVRRSKKRRPARSTLERAGKQRTHARARLYLLPRAVCRLRLRHRACRCNPLVTTRRGNPTRRRPRATPPTSSNPNGALCLAVYPGLPTPFFFVVSARGYSRTV